MPKADALVVRNRLAQCRLVPGMRQDEARCRTYDKSGVVSERTNIEPAPAAHVGLGPSMTLTPTQLRALTGEGRRVEPNAELIGPPAWR